MELAALITLTGCEDRLGRKREADRYNKQAVNLKMRLPRHKRQGRFNDKGLNYFLPPLPGGINRRQPQQDDGLTLLHQDGKTPFRNVVHSKAKVNAYNAPKPIYS